MRIAIDMLLAEQEPGGMFFATHALLEGLARIDHDNQYYVITARPDEYADLSACTQAPNIHFAVQKILFNQRSRGSKKITVGCFCSSG